MQRKIPNINFRDKLHSIPINKMKDVKSNVLYSIPGGCIVALLLVGLVSFVPDLFSTMPGISSNGSAYAATETFGDSNASITLDTSNVEVKVTPGTKGYASKNITIQTNNAKDYNLTITAPATLSRENDATNKASSWGYAYGQTGGLDTMSYTSFTGAAQTLASGNGDISNSKILAISADFTNNPASGHYKAEVNLALTVTPKVAIEYTLSYNTNGGTGSYANQTCTAYDNGTCTITLSSTKPTRSGYEFLGWADASNATTAQYQPGATIAMSVSKTVYGVWKAIVFGGITTMQDLTPSLCSAASENDTAFLTDSRDGNKYWVTKLKDGNCWMTQNLAWKGATPFTDPGAYVLKDPASTTACSSVADLSSCANVIDVSGRTPSSDPNFYVNNGATYSNTEYDAHYSVGLYYAYSETTVYYCPLNWRTPPTGTGKNSFGYIANQYGVAASRLSPVFMAAVGYYNSATGNVYGNVNKGIYYMATEALTTAAIGTEDGWTRAHVFNSIDNVLGSDTNLWTGWRYPVRCYMTSNITNS